MRAVALCLLAAVLSARVSAANLWESRPSGTTQALYGVAHADGATWVAVGAGGTIVRSTDDGASWSAVTGVTADDLRGVAFRGSTGLAVGIGGRLLRSEDSGLHWTSLTRPVRKILEAVSMQDSFAVITGEEGTILVSTDGGLTWTLRSAGTASVLFGVSVRDGAVVGVGGQGAVVMSAVPGAGWGLTVPGGQLTFFYATSFATAQTGWLVGTSSTQASIVARSDLSGITWSAQSAPTNAGLFGVSAPSLDVVTAVGELGTVIHTVDGGAHWLEETSGTSAKLNAVAFATTQLGVAVGDGGTILRSTVDGLAGAGEAAGGTRLAIAALGNPARAGRARFAFTLPAEGRTELRVLDVTGRLVATLADGELTAGRHELAWAADGSTPPGVYFAELRAAGREAAARFVIEH